MPDPAFIARRHALALALLTLAAAIVTDGVLSRRSHARGLEAQAAAMSMPAVRLIEPVSLSAGELELPARLEAWSQASIMARVGGYLRHWTVDIGTPVKAGQLLGEIETPELDEQLAQARAELATARSNLELAASTARRWQSLLASDSVSRQEADEKSADLAAKQSAVNALQANLDRVLATKRYARLVAPFDGVVTARNTDVGSLIGAGGAPGQDLFVVSDIHRLRVYVNVPQRQATTVKVGSPARLIVPEQPGRAYAARVQAVSRAIQSNSGAMLVQLSVDNPDGELLPGGYATVRFAQADAPSDRIGVPPGALIYSKAGVQVATLQASDRVQLKPVTIARDMGSVVELQTGLARGDRVIDSPPDGLADGDRVRVVAAAGDRAAR